MKRRWTAAAAHSTLALICFAVRAPAQLAPMDVYLAGAGQNLDFLKKPAAERENKEVDNVLPLQRQASFAEYVNVKLGDDSADLRGILDTVAALRLNKLVGNSSASTGSTSLLSRVAAPAVLGLGVEYGGVLQQNNGAVTTLRANLLGVGRMLFGGSQFPYCPALDQKNCQPASRHLRRFSGSIAFSSRAAATGVATPAPTLPADLAGGDFRMANWGLRFDLTPSNNLDDPGYQARWTQAITELRKNQATKDLPAAVRAVFDKTVEDDSYGEWQAQALTELKAASDEAAFRTSLERQLDQLIALMSSKDPEFKTRIQALRRAFSNFFTVRDQLLQNIHSHKLALEYLNQHPLGQVSTSSVRFIYSHQPTAAPTLITANAAVTFYNSLAQGAPGGRTRDVQLAGQIDRRLSQIPRFGYAVLTFAGYYQWMKEDALITIGSGNIAPGSGIVLPAAAAPLLGTKGHIGVFQAKLSIPAGAVLKVPFSFTWANRTELINEADKRLQVGLTLDLDSLFH